MFRDRCPRCPAVARSAPARYCRRFSRPLAMGTEPLRPWRSSYRTGVSPAKGRQHHPAFYPGPCTRPHAGHPAGSSGGEESNLGFLLPKQARFRYATSRGVARCTQPGRLESRRVPSRFRCTGVISPVRCRAWLATWRNGGSNPGPAGCGPAALPLSYFPRRCTCIYGACTGRVPSLGSGRRLAQSLEPEGGCHYLRTSLGNGLAG
jgi:hypothetical protein